MAQLIPLDSFGVTERDVEGALGRVKVRNVDYADLYFESCVSESVSMEESLVKRATKSISQGVGVRATAGETGFAYSDELTKRDLELAADTARYIAHSPGGTEPVPVPVRSRPTRDLYPVSFTAGSGDGGAGGAPQPYRRGSTPVRSAHQKRDGFL